MPARDRDELAHGRYEAADKRAGRAVLVEILLGFLYLGLVNQAGVAQARVGKGIDYWPADKQRQHIVD